MYVIDVCMMGYESLWGCYKMELLNPEITQLNTVVTGAARSVKISYNNSGSNFLQRTVHGRYADILPRSTDGSSSTYFCDENYFSSDATYYIWVNTTPAGGGGSTEGQGIFMLKTAWVMPTTDFTGQKTTARIAFDGTINIMDKTNPAAFKAL